MPVGHVSVSLHLCLGLFLVNGLELGYGSRHGYWSGGIRPSTPTCTRRGFLKGVSLGMISFRRSKADSGEIPNGEGSERILDEIATLVTRYYLYAHDTRLSAMRFDLQKWLRAKDTLKPQAARSDEAARDAAERLIRMGNFDKYTTFLRPRILQERVRKFSETQVGVPVPDEDIEGGILTRRLKSQSQTHAPNVLRPRAPSGVRLKIFRRTALRQRGVKVALIKIPSFVAGTAIDVRKSLERASTAGVQELILDLRHNKGGNVDQGLEIARELLPSNTHLALFVDTVGERWESVGESARHLNLADIPVIVLVDGATSSTAEVLSAGLRDNCRGVLVGRQTFGKARIQTVFGLSDGSGLQLTVGGYLTPNLEAIQARGLKPDIQSILPAEWVIPDQAHVKELTKKCFRE
ncbi:hypothetical protein AAMO2058_000530900 [Amorphochlora amoebiformis]